MSVNFEKQSIAQPSEIAQSCFGETQQMTSRNGCRRVTKPVNFYKDNEESILETAPVLEYDCSLNDI